MRLRECSAEPLRRSSAGPALVSKPEMPPAKKTAPILVKDRAIGGISGGAIQPDSASWSTSTFSLPAGSICLNRKVEYPIERSPLVLSSFMAGT